MSLTPKNWASFQHYKNRSPAWIKLHRGLLDDFDFSRLPVASRALAPLLWLLASEYEDGIVTASMEEIAYRFRMSESELIIALTPLIESKFFDASEVLAECGQDACLEKEVEKENIDKRKSESARTDLQKRTGDFRQAIVQAYAEVRSTVLPETSRAGLWISQGFQEDICLAVIAGVLGKNPSIGSLSYFDKPIAEAHTKKAPPRKAINGPAPLDWDAVLTSYKKFGHWSRDAGPDLSSPACRAPPEMLEKYGLGMDA